MPQLSPDARALLDAVTAMTSDLDLHKVLDRIVASACSLTGARYGALGVIGPDGLSDFITHGVSDEERRRIGDPPHGRGILGLLIQHPAPLRLENLQEHASSYGFPANHPPMTSFLGMPVLIRGTVFGNLYLTEKAGGVPFTESDERLLEALSTAAGHVIENARAYAVSELQRSWLEITSRLNDALRPGITMEEALEVVAVATRTVSRARGVALIRSDGHGGVEVLARDGRDADAMESLATEHAELIIAAASGGHPAPDKLTSGGHLLALPLRTHLASALVLVVVMDDAGRTFGTDRSWLDLVMSFGDQVALALDRVQALAEREQLAIVSDRDRIARDLHDLVIQRLFATGLQLQGVHSQVDSPVVAARIDQAVSDLDTTISDIRGTIFQLRKEPPVELRSQADGP